jgi:threonine dehydrogenase-like Zn-dependent dehydrogenase
VIDAVALDATLDEAMACVRPGGTVSIIGVHDLSP